MFVRKWAYTTRQAHAAVITKNKYRTRNCEAHSATFASTPQSLPSKKSSTHCRQRWAWIPVSVLLLSSIWLGARGLNIDAFWYDEWLSLYYAGGAHYGPITPGQIWERVGNQSTWPPGFPTLYAGWGMIFGWNQDVGRILPLLIGVMAIAVVYRMGKDIASPLVGLSAAVIVSTSALFIYYLHELRGYTLCVFLAALCAWMYWRIIHRRRSLLSQILFCGSMAGLLYLNYFAALIIAAIGIYHVFFVPKSRKWWRVPALMFAAGLLFLPWLSSLFTTISTVVGQEYRYAIDYDAIDALEALVTTFGNGGFSLLSLLLIYALFSKRSKVKYFLWLWLTVVVAISLGVNEVIQVLFHPRHMLMLWPVLALLGGLGIERLSKYGVSPLILLGIWIIPGIYNTFNPNFILQQPGQEASLPWDSLSPILERLEQESTSDDLAVFHVAQAGREWLTEPIVDYYLYSIPATNTQFEQIPGLLKNDDYFKQVLTAIEDAPRVWTVIMPSVPMSYHVSEFQRALVVDYMDCGTVVNAPEMNMNLYVRRPDDDINATAHFEGGIALKLIQPLPDSNNRTFIDLVLGWKVEEIVPPDIYSIGLYIVNAEGHLIKQIDYPLPGQGWNCQSSNFDISDLATGEYQLLASVYQWEDGTRLPVQSIRRKQQNSIVLGMFQVK